MLPVDRSWFEDHFYGAPQQVVDFFGGDGISLSGARVADIGTGDGIIAFGLFEATGAAELVGFDLNPIDLDHLVGIVGKAPPPGLRYERSFENRIPAPDAAFDFVVSWSAFEHVSEPATMFREIRRILTPTGIVMIQLYPFYFSEHGDHGWERPGFEHLVTGRDQVPGDAYVNRITLDDLHLALRAGGLRIAKLELIHHPFHLPHELADVGPSKLSIGGVKLLAVPFEPAHL
jgi:SAM-dependent methyltransferase